MKAIMVTRAGGPEMLELGEFPPPQPHDGELLIRVEAVGLNFADLLGMQGNYSGGPPPPYVPGREFAGLEVTTGRLVMGYAEYGALAEQIAAAPARVWPVPPQFTAVQAAAFPVNFLTAFLADAVRAS
jgi:NADPH2:quinone reductase